MDRPLATPHRIVKAAEQDTKGSSRFAGRSENRRETDMANPPAKSLKFLVLGSPLGSANDFK
jgi:hypothetical protein